MKKWEMPEIAELEIVYTEQGQNMDKQRDEIRVDQNGNYWAGFGSGADSNPETNGGVTVID